jgi:hypothetical protein
MDAMHEIEHLADATHAAAAFRLARVIVSATNIAADAGVPLNDEQKIALITTAFLELEGLGREVHDLLELEHLLTRSSGNGRTPP